MMTKLLNSTKYSFQISLILLSTLSLSVLNICHEAECSVTSSWMEERLFDRARCKANCLKLFSNPKEQEVFHNKWGSEKFNDLNWSVCFEESRERCSSSCFIACDLPPAECFTHCAGSAVGCYIGCLLVNQTFEKRPGECPRELVYSVFDFDRSVLLGQDDHSSYRKHESTNKCINNCQLDSECTNPLQICCKSDCHQQCTNPIFNELVPPISTHLNSTVSTINSNSVKLFWSTLYKNLTSSINPIVFILQVRICICKQFDENYSSKWQTLIMTHEFGANLEAFEPGRLYQFRIAAVSIHGTRGFGLSTKAYPINPVQPRPPDPPRNVTDSMWRLYSSGKISLLLKWQPPRHSDLPVSEYLINWSVDHGYLQTDGRSLESFIQYTLTTNADRTECILQNLKPATSYKIQVKAISYWNGYGNLESQPNTVFLSTQSIHPAFHQQSIDPVETHLPPKRVAPTPSGFAIQSKSSNCECGSSVQPLLLKKIFYDSNKLNAVLQINFTIEKDTTTVIQWFPQVCIDSNEPLSNTVRRKVLQKYKDSEIILEDLYFSCRYSVRIQMYAGILDEKYLSMVTSGISIDNQYLDSRGLHSCFCTPSCLDVEIKQGGLPENCPPPAPVPPLPPTQLKVMHMGDLDYQISWVQSISTQERKIRTADKDSRLSFSNKLKRNSTKYRIIWAPRIHEPVDESMYNDEIGFSPIMDLQQTDVRVINKDQTWIALKKLKPNTFYIVRVQTLLILPNGMERESNPVSVYFTTAGEEEMKNSHSGKYYCWCLNNNCKELQVSVYIYIIIANGDLSRHSSVETLKSRNDSRLIVESQPISFS
uniref:Fibronectin type-III domain-containing protein n=1 Tax=Trichobilharzia regenti TaxID=157069 RepID=A0AA85KF68_TRIRE|nr:unnamed protein product [Trichobilharzia regenti]